MPETKNFSCVRQWGGLDQGPLISAEAGLGIAAEGMDMADLLLDIAHLHAEEEAAMVAGVAEEEARRFLFWFEI